MRASVCLPKPNLDSQDLSFADPIPSPSTVILSKAAIEDSHLQDSDEANSSLNDEELLPETAREIVPYRPFPTKLLPEPVRQFVERGARSIGCDPAFVALPQLVVLASAIGNTRRLQLKSSWHVPPILWSIIIGESGSAKSPAFSLVMKLVEKRQAAAMSQYKKDCERHELDMARWTAAMREWTQKRKGTTDPPEKPKAPTPARYMVGDTTVEALVPLFEANPRGLLAAKDELSGWLGSFDRYASGGSSDEAAWLSMYNGSPLTVDRKTGDRKTFYVPRAAACVMGGIQPGILERKIGQEHKESGLLARFLLVHPPRETKVWRDDHIDTATEARMEQLLDRLWSMEFLIDDNGQLAPRLVRLNAEAFRLWKSFYNAHGVEQAEETGDLAAAFSKLEETAARLALVIHCVRAAADDPALEYADEVDARSMSSAIALVTWFKYEIRRVYSMMSESGEHKQHRKLIEWIGRQGGMVTAREVQQGCRSLKKSGMAQNALNQLEAAGVGHWEDSPEGVRGQPTHYFRLASEYCKSLPGRRSKQDRGRI